MATCELVIELFTRLAAGIVFTVKDAPDEMIGILNVLVPVQILFNDNKDEPLIDFTYATLANSLLFKPLFEPNVVVEICIVVELEKLYRSADTVWLPDPFVNCIF